MAHALTPFKTTNPSVRVLMCALLATGIAIPSPARAAEDSVCEAPPPAAAPIPADQRLRVTVMDQYGPYGGSDVLTLAGADGIPLLAMVCQGPRAVFPLPPGSYRVAASAGTQWSSEVPVTLPGTDAPVVLTLPTIPDANHLVP